VTYEGSVPLVFGFQAARLYYEGGRYQRFELLSDTTTLARGAPQRPAEILGQGTFVRLGEV
jgi:hypothetical protein